MSTETAQTEKQRERKTKQTPKIYKNCGTVIKDVRYVQQEYQKEREKNRRNI